MQQGLLEKTTIAITHSRIDVAVAKVPDGIHAVESGARQLADVFGEVGAQSGGKLGQEGLFPVQFQECYSLSVS